MCEICCEFFIFQRNNVSAQWVRTASVSVSLISDFWSGRLQRLFHQVCDSNIQIWTQWTTRLHRTLTASLPKKIHNMNWPTLWYCWHGSEQRIVDNATDELCKRLWVCVYVKGRLSLQISCWIQKYKTVWLQSLHSDILISSFVKITRRLMLLCWIYHNFNIFIFLHFAR